ncbi:MAG: GNAT family N-acetyltransferase [Verrucomicrobia bacterium]|nr:MAG: GNAT family N-acetyltransferase [Verrucomicrobiota bacterium]
MTVRTSSAMLAGMERAEIILRAYQPADEAAVRRICFETALFGGPIRSVLDDEALVSEALVGYYLRYATDLLFVAEVDGVVAGYLGGCADTARYRRTYAWRIAPWLVLRFLLRGHWLRPQLWPWLLAGVRVARLKSASHARIATDYPAHGHLNLASAFRHQGIGWLLLEHFLNELRRRGVRGLHISANSPGGQAFFARAGFKRLLDYPLPPLPGQPPRRVQIMGFRV